MPKRASSNVGSGVPPPSASFVSFLCEAVGVPF